MWEAFSGVIESNAIPKKTSTHFIFSSAFNTFLRKFSIKCKIWRPKTVKKNHDIWSISLAKIKIKIVIIYKKAKSYDGPVSIQAKV